MKWIKWIKRNEKMICSVCVIAWKIGCVDRYLICILLVLIHGCNHHQFSKINRRSQGNVKMEMVLVFIIFLINNSIWISSVLLIFYILIFNSNMYGSEVSFIFMKFERNYHHESSHLSFSKCCCVLVIFQQLRLSSY